MVWYTVGNIYFGEGTTFPSYFFALLFSQIPATYDMEVPCHPLSSTLIECHHYPSPELLTIVANNPSERAFRDRILTQHANKYVGVVKACEAYVPALQAGHFSRGSQSHLDQPNLDNVVELMPAHAS